MTKAPQNSNLDILRSVAVLAVFLCHLLQVMAGCKFGERLAFGIETYSLGQIGVVIFFVHTSLVLMQSMERTGHACPNRRWSDTSTSGGHFAFTR